MKKFYFVSALALLATALTVSCEREMPINEPAKEAPQMRTFTCTFAQPADTKISVGEDGKTKWLPGDEIMIHGGENGADRYKVTLTAGDISADGKTAKISFAIDPYDRTDAGVVSKYYAQYPASLNSEGEIYYECRFTDSNDFIMGACDVDDTFVFYNLNAVISYKVTGDFDKLVFTGNSGEVVGYEGVYQARVRNEGSGAKLTNPKFGNGSGDGKSLNSVTKVPVVDGTINYIFIPGGVNFSEGFTFSFYKDDEIKKVAKTTKAVKVDSGKLLALGDITSHLEDYVETTDPVSDHKSAITGATDISAQQANCYVVTAAGAYKFPALMGNTTDALANVHGVEVMWETYGNDAEVTAGSVIAAADFEDNWIYFKTPDTLKPGNALIAAKDHEGKITWSWHIWIPSTTVNVVDATEVAGLKMMDRNLGALVVTDATNGAAVESYGLYYQYGRKDPILGPKRVDSSSLSTVAEGQHTITLNGGAMTLNESIANPTVFGNVSGGNWQSGSKSQWSFNKKTAYDPCPKGYRVAWGEKSSSATYPLWNSSNIATAAPGWEVSKDNHWFKVGTGDGTLVFPLGGYYDDNQEGESLGCTHAGDRSGVWFMATNSSSCYHLNMRADSGSYKAGSTSGARGCAVRCCVDE